MEEMLTSMLDAQHFLFRNICLVVSCKFRVYFFITAQIAKDARSIYIALAGQFRQSGQHWIHVKPQVDTPLFAATAASAAAL